MGLCEWGLSGPTEYLDPNRLTLIVFLKEFFDKVNFLKSQWHEKLPSMQRVIYCLHICGI